MPVIPNVLIWRWIPWNKCSISIFQYTLSSNDHFFGWFLFLKVIFANTKIEGEKKKKTSEKLIVRNKIDAENSPFWNEILSNKGNDPSGLNLFQKYSFGVIVRIPTCSLEMCMHRWLASELLLLLSIPLLVFVLFLVYFYKTKQQNTQQTVILFMDFQNVALPEQVFKPFLCIIFQRNLLINNFDMIFVFETIWSLPLHRFPQNNKAVKFKRVYMPLEKEAPNLELEPFCL